MWYLYQPYGWGMIIFGVLLVLLVGALVALIVWSFRPHRGSNRPVYAEGEAQPHPAHDALEILKERYARGEITKTEYEQIRDDLKK